MPDENRQALREINEQITRLTPAVLGTPARRAAAIQTAGKVKLDCMTRRCGEDLYVFAVNFDERAAPADATISVPELPAGTTIEVVDEGRSLRSEAGVFRDAFPPLGVHIYKMHSPATGQ